MKEFWNTVQFVFTAVGGWLGYAGDRYGQCVTDSGGLLLSFQ